MIQFELHVSIFHDDGEDVTEMLGVASSVGGAFEAFNETINSVTDQTARVELRFKNSIALAFESRIDVIQAMSAVGGENDGTQN